MTCMFCQDGCAHCNDGQGPLPPPYPKWYTPSKYRIAGNRRAAEGRHPMGRPLGREDRQCKDCAFLVRHQYNRTYSKCLKSGNTRGPATDIVQRWRCCDLFERKGAEMLVQQARAAMVSGANGVRMLDGFDLDDLLDVLRPNATEADAVLWDWLLENNPQAHGAEERG